MIKLLRSGGRPDDVDPLDPPLLILFCKRARGPVQVVRVNSATAALIEACDGDRTIPGVAEQLSHTAGTGAKAQTQVAAAIAQLRDAGVVGLRRRQSGPCRAHRLGSAPVSVQCDPEKCF